MDGLLLWFIWGASLTNTEVKMWAFVSNIETSHRVLISSVIRIILSESAACSVNFSGRTLSSKTRTQWTRWSSDESSQPLLFCGQAEGRHPRPTGNPDPSPGPHGTLLDSTEISSSFLCFLFLSFVISQHETLTTCVKACGTVCNESWPWGAEEQWQKRSCVQEVVPAGNF